jgi:pSer/pThr/pTyr-binding forkhead associated (FHA) protein
MREKINAYLRLEKSVKGKVEGPEKWDVILLSTDSMLIGRTSEDPELSPPDIKIIGDDYVSRNQAKIYYSYSDGCFMLRDTMSRNGTFINGELIEKNQPYSLQDNDIIGLAKIAGEIRVTFRFRDSDETLPPWVEEEPVRSPPEKGLFINLPAKRVYVNRKEVCLSNMELKMLEVLYRNRGNACGYDDIAWEVWGPDGASDELIAQYIRRLRERIEADPSNPQYIITPKGHHRCYRLDL